MTTTVSQLTAQALLSFPYERLTTTVGVLVFVLLAVLLLFREVLAVAGDGRSQDRARALDIAIAPLLIVFGVIVIARLVLSV
jgi:hypothetical protein